MKKYLLVIVVVVYSLIPLGLNANQDNYVFEFLIRKFTASLEENSKVRLMLGDEPGNAIPQELLSNLSDLSFIFVDGNTDFPVTLTISIEDVFYPSSNTATVITVVNGYEGWMYKLSYSGQVCSIVDEAPLPGLGILED